MPHDNHKYLAMRRIEQSSECIQSADAALEISLKMSINRSYYGILHSMRAVLALDKFDSKKHQGIISVFRERYIKSGKFAVHFSDVIGSAFQIRNRCDYDDFYVAAESDARRQLENAKEFLSAVTEFISNAVSACADPD